MPGRARSITAAAFVALAACSSAVDLDALSFACTTDLQCTRGHVCDPARKVCVAPVPDSGVLPGCNPACTLGATCDEERNRCVLPNGSCTQSPPIATATGFSADFVESLPRDVELFGTAYCAADGVRLTETMVAAGAVWHAARHRARKFRFSAELAIEPATPPAEIRGEGLTLAWVSSPPALGGGGGHLGVVMLDGWFVELDDLQNTGDRCTPESEPAAPHVAFVRTTTASIGSGDPCFSTTIAAAPIPNVSSNGFHRWVVDFDATRGDTALIVTLDDVRVLESAAPGYALDEATFGATASTYIAADAHVVRRLELVTE
ncbi:hypothetical protein L6R52_42635 [Myxococcota bacterium]|nr:hypothetical protein [Myxococcota bacterium]